MLVTLCGIIVAFACSIVAYYKWKFQYWRRRNVPSIPGTIPFGSLGSPFATTKTVGVRIKDIYDEVRPKKWKCVGIYTFARPNLIPIDPALLKLILTKDFSHFVDRGRYHNEKDDPISAHLFAIGGPKWRSLRTKLTPTFTSGKMKTMFPTLVECVAPLEDVMARIYKQHNGVVDINEVLGCFTTDIIGSCAFGLDFNTFKEENSPFRVYGKKFFTTTKSAQLKNLLATNYPDIARSLRYREIAGDISAFFTGVVRNTVDYRAENGYRRPDFMQILIDMKERFNDDEESRGLTFEEIVAQAFVFFLAGFETSSSTMTFVLYELARHPHIQGKVRAEITNVLAKHDGKITYEAIHEMKYMNQVIDEALRIYPPVPGVTRQCVKDYEVPGEGFTIDKGTIIIIPTLGLQHDPEYFPKPEMFDPERFSDENRHRIQAYSYMPFGEGPRACIGLRFGLMQTKVGLAALLRNYHFTVNEKTKEPITFQQSSVILAAVGEVWLNVQHYHG